MNKVTYTLAIFASAMSISHMAHADLSGQLQLTGFAGGNCSLNVSASPNAGNLNLDLGFQPQIPVGTVSKTCDFPHQLTVSTDSASQGITRLMHTNGVDFSDINVFVDGQNINFPGSNIPQFIPGAEFSNSMPVTLDINSPPGMSGIYSNTLTFTIVVD